MRGAPLAVAMRAAAVVPLLALVSLAGCFGLTDTVEPTDYIRDSQYTRWIIEIDYVQGHAPSASATSALQDRMEELVRKPDGISVRTASQPMGVSADGGWSDSEIQDLHKRFQDRKTDGDTIVTHVLYLDGRSSEQQDRVGVAFGHEYVVVFKERIEEGCSVLSGCVGAQTTIETAVLVHEFGHVIGLVNHGIDMVVDHEDRDHPRHSDNQRSVMYWAVETTGVFTINNIPTTFDSNDKRDVCEAGGKGSC